MEDVVSADGKSIGHPALEGGDDGFASGELLDPPRQGGVGCFWNVMLFGWW